MVSKGKRIRTPDTEESLESLFAAAGLGEDSFHRPFKRVQTRHPSSSGCSAFEGGVQTADEGESSITYESANLHVDRFPGVLVDGGPAVSANSQATLAAARQTSGRTCHNYTVRRRSDSSSQCDIDVSSDSESEASVTRWRRAGPSAGGSAADSGYSAVHLQGHAAFADSATSQRYVLPRFTISTRTRPGEAAASHPLLQPQPLRPHTSQFQPSQALSAANFPSSSSGSLQQAPWPLDRAPGGLSQSTSLPGHTAGGQPDEQNMTLHGRDAFMAVAAPNVYHPRGAALASRPRPRGLADGDDEEEEDDEAEGRDDRRVGSRQGLPGRNGSPSERRFPGVAPLLVNVGFNAILDELPGRLERIQVAGEVPAPVALTGGAQEPGEGIPQVLRQPEAEIAQPRTPTRDEECPTPREGRARAVGVRSSSREEEKSYESLYEETNNLLKNLHFERVKRLGSSAPSAWSFGSIRNASLA